MKSENNTKTMPRKRGKSKTIHRREKRKSLKNERKIEEN